MSLILNGLQLAGSILRTSLSNRVVPIRQIFRSSILRDDEEGEVAEKKIHPAKDRSRIIPFETSIRYLNSEAYKTTYGDNPVWKFYRRNHKGAIPPRKTRKTCIRNRIVTTSNPCPICRDEYLVLDYRNVDLLKQFIDEHSGEILSYRKTGLCQKRHKELLVMLVRAKDYGTITFDVPLRQYDYSEWMPSEMQQ